jgi:DNA-binding transcriptional MerR regulator
MEKMLPAIPPKRYFTIGEVSDLCGVKPYVLRYWEQEFTQLKPMKRRGNRRYYQHHEVLLIRRIRDLLYDQGFTIVGARNRLTDLPLDPSPTEFEGDDAFELDSVDARVLSAALGTSSAARSTVELAMQRPPTAPAASASVFASVPASMPAAPDASAPPSGVGRSTAQSPLAPASMRQELLAIRDLLRP